MLGSIALRRLLPMPMLASCRARALRLLLLATSSCSFAVRATALQSERSVLQNGDYCFQLALPDVRWSFLDAEDTRALAPDAAAAAMTPKGEFGFVVVESTFASTLREHANIVYGAITLEDKSRTELVEIEFAGRKALRWQMSGKVDQIAITWDFALVDREGFTYQVVCGGQKSSFETDSAQLSAFHRAFSFLDCKPHEPTQVFANADTTDVGCELRGGVFRSAVYGYVVEPRSSWRVVIGDELRGMNADAHVGLMHSDPAIYVIVISERLEPSEGALGLRVLQDEHAESLERTIPVLPARILGERARLRPMPTQVPGMEILRASFHTHGSLLQVLAWYRDADATQARGLLPQGLASLRWMSEKEQAEVAARLALAPDRQSWVTPTGYLRAGNARDFEARIRWKRPNGTWRVQMGEAARERDEYSLLYAEELALGIEVQLTVEEAEGYDLKAYTQLVSELAFEAGAAAAPKPRKFGDSDGLVTSGTSTDTIALTRCIATVVAHDRAYQLSVTGTELNMARAHVAVEAVLGGFEVLARAERARTRTSFSVTDQRLGYELRRPEASWSHSIVPLDETAPLGAGDVYASKQGAIGLVAVWSEQDGGAMRVLADLAVKAITAEHGRTFPGEPVETPSSFQGRAARLFTWSHEDDSLEVLSFVRDGTLYMLFGVGPTRSALLAKARTCVRLLP